MSDSSLLLHLLTALADPAARLLHTPRPLSATTGPPNRHTAASSRRPSLIAISFNKSPSARPTAMERTPFVPVRKHKPSNSPPTSPAPRLPRSPASTGGSFLGGHPAPLGASTAHNRLAPAAPIADPFAPPPPALLSPPTAAPRIRAKLTPSAAPRRKALPGAERADVPLAGGGGYSPVKVRPIASPSPLLAAPAPGGFGAFPKVTSASLAHANEWGVEAAMDGLQGLQISERGTVTGKGGRDNVLVCVRCADPFPPPSPLSTRRRADGDLDTAYALLRPSSLLPPRKEPTSAPGKSTSARASCSSTPAGPSTRLVRCFSS